MGSLWFLKLAFKCIDRLAWPLLALGYPLCASVQAIETDSYAETRDLISYWILLSLVYLFECAFLRILQWFQFWPYIKLMIIFWLIVPDFRRASSVYNNLICLCISLKPETVISRLKNWRKLFVKKENFLLQAEKYIKENGTEALEKLITSKNTTRNPDAEATNAIIATDMKEMQQKQHHVQTNGKRLQTEHKDVKDLEVIDKKEIPAVKQEKEKLYGKQMLTNDIPVMPNLSSPNTSSAVVETKGMVGKEIAGAELPQSSTYKEVQKEWTCPVCQVTTTCENNSNSSQLWRIHKADCEVLKGKIQFGKIPFVPLKLKNDQSKEELNQKKITNQDANIEQRNIQTAHAKEYAQTSKENRSTYFQKGILATPSKTDQPNAKTKNGESIVNNYKPVGRNPSKLRCEVCDVSCGSEVDMASHLKGRKHLEYSKLI